MDNIVLTAQARQVGTSRSARRIRREGWIPANLYGQGKANLSFMVREDEVMSLLSDGHHMAMLDLDGQQGQGLIREIQYDAMGKRIVHLDFSRISLDDVIETKVTLTTFGTPKGIANGGILDIAHPEIPIRGKARDLPDSIEVDIAHLGMNEQLRVKDITLPPGMECVFGPEEPVVMVHAPRGTAADEEVEELTEPEVIGEKPPAEKKE